MQQECIPVGCVTPAAVAVRGGLNQAPCPPQDQAPPPETRHPPGTRHPPPGPGTPTVDRHTPVNILPCPKLRLRVVKMGAKPILELNGNRNGVINLRCESIIIPRGQLITHKHEVASRQRPTYFNHGHLRIYTLSFRFGNK